MCIHLVKKHYFCSCDETEVTPEDAWLLSATDDKRHCRTFTFYPCTHTLSTGVYCTPYTSGSMDKFYTLIESLPNTIVLVLLSDCNSDDCQNSRPRDKTDRFSVPNVQKVVRTVKKGAEEEMQSTLWVRERNRALLEKVGLVQGTVREDAAYAEGASRGARTSSG
ncbi:uncharacterized protein LAJ45_01043 [Morchella importuna]|uniref:uncharacterized protein n=1 Tax=Morchella importuna TaxID=1174673 RepID=UPI001E8DAFA9|nr:uncharacterized protein LAJ45_01043 [Morchella importuna]KAH8154515.1 hypothetical protein LAJ45_01043 [Morchella importuna]